MVEGIDSFREWFKGYEDTYVIIGDPAEDIHCRCSTIDVVQGLEPTLRRGVNPATGKSDIASYRDYDKWKKQGLK